MEKRVGKGNKSVTKEMRIVLNKSKGKKTTTEQKIKSILSARRNLYAAGIALLEVDDTYAGNIKRELEQYTLARHTASSAKATPKPLDEDDVRFYLEMFLRIYIREENITFDEKNNVCHTKLNERMTANIRMQNGTAVKSIFVYSLPY